MRFALTLTLALALAAAACAPVPSGRGPTTDTLETLGDSVIVPGPGAVAPDLIREGALTLDGGARYDTVTVGEAGVLRAETEPQLAAARRLLDSGVYLADPYRVLRLSPAAGVDAVAALGREVEVGTPVSTELLIRTTGPAPAPTLRFEHIGRTRDGGRRMPSAIAFELLPAADGGYDRARLLLGDGENWTEQEVVPLPPGDWETYAHRVGIVVARDVASIAVDGNAVIEQRVRIYGRASAPRLRAVAGAAGAGVTVLQITGLVEDDPDDNDDDDGDDDDDD